ncbi:gag-protease polyprotein [Cucumis melo var. makuwa]|uniref:Gag-protease polyprotein n=1 Tax=Cucumis melo var. makuwa TaxID=1194695 RepID=A0A5D3BST9_CUCMM|nr:gag-protease polyprotein [Cucumis melo var. makuwa]
MQKFFSTNLRYAKQQKFLNLKQGNMTLEQYDTEFDMLSRFALEVVANKAARNDKFVSGLRLDPQGFVQAFRPTTHVDALHLAVHISIHERADPSKTARKWSPAASSKDCCNKKDLERTTCLSSCGRSHGGRCLAGSGTPTPQQRRVFATTRQEVEQAGTVVTGTLSILGYFAFVLFDSREIDFVTELEPDIVPISRAPYRMVIAELKELRVQLQELLDKVSNEGVSVDPAKIEAVTSWPQPSTVIEIRSFLDLAGYYRRFMEDFSRIASPLTQLTRKRTPSDNH